MSNSVKRAKFSIDNETHFSTVDGEIYGLGGKSNFIQSLQSAANLLLSDPNAKSVNLVSGHVIRLVCKD
jgi:hypothetical protein